MPGKELKIIVLGFGLRRPLRIEGTGLSNKAFLKVLSQPPNEYDFRRDGAHLYLSKKGKSKTIDKDELAALRTVVEEVGATVIIIFDPPDAAWRMEPLTDD